MRVWVEDELSEISLINQILEVSSEGTTFDGGMTYHVIEGAIILISGSFQVLCKQSSRASDQRLIFDGVEHMAYGNSEWNYVGLYRAVLV